MTAEEMRERMRDYERKALEKFPLKLIETTGDKALAKWQELKAAGQGSPVILADDDDLDSLGSLLDPFGPDVPDELAPVDTILRQADGIEFPADLVKDRRAEAEFFLQKFKADLAAKPEMSLPRITETDGVTTRTLSREEVLAAMVSEPEEPPLGEWPANPEPSIGLTVVRNILTNEPLSKVYIGIAPTDDWTTIPAYLRWGGWNECPAAKHHVAAMRTWRDRYGAELVGMSGNTINLRAATRPQTREEALALARQHYVYCADIIDQGFPSYSALAAYLMANDWWYFWWD
jgi:hypothetical protein